MKSALKILVIGRHGQVAASLSALADPDIAVTALGRPDIDLADRSSIDQALAGLDYDAIINAAAYTAVDKAEQEEALAMRINADGPGYLAEIADRRGVPFLHISTDYVFSGDLDRPYREGDPVGPTGAYGRSKWVGEKRVAEGCANHAIFRTAWVYSPYGANFVRTMLRLGQTRAQVGVVADQYGDPTSALDLAQALIAAARRMTQDSSPRLRGVFHMSGASQTPTSWADLAQETFALAEAFGRTPVRVDRITTADYPTPARRPANSRLDNAKLAETFGLRLPPWRESLSACVGRLLSETAN